jgi:hypothetical protein
MPTYNGTYPGEDNACRRLKVKHEALEKNLQENGE